LLNYREIIMSNNQSNLIVYAVVGLLIGAAIGYFVYPAMNPGPAGEVVDKADYDALQAQLTEAQGDLDDALDQIADLEKVTEYQIGFSLPLTGQLAEIGTQWRTVVNMAIEDLNDEVEAIGLKASFTAIVQDDKTSATEAVTTVQTLAQTGIKVIVGPAGSDQVKAAKIYADDNNVVIITPSSTTPTLAIPGDYIFRTVGSDATQSKALAATINTQGITKVILFVRNDEYGNAFADFIKDELEVYNINSVKLPYDPSLSDYASEVSQLSSIAETEGADGIVIVTYDSDGVNIMSHAMDDAYLTSIQWFSSEGVHGATSLLEEDIAQFIDTVSLMGTRPLFRDNELLKAFNEEYKNLTGRDSPVFSANLYDAIKIAGWSILKAESYDGAAIKAVLPDVAASYYGTSGVNILDEAGDKAVQDYAVWTVSEVEGSNVFVDIGNYAGGTISLD
jgi:branched-chain amino acid transport system substrate-binding protein